MCPCVDGLVDHHAGLQHVVGRVPEDVVAVVVRRLELVGDDRAGGDVVEHRNFGFLIEALRGERHAGVDEAQCGDDLLLADELLRDLGADLVLGLVVALDELDLPAEHAAGLVDLGGSQSCAVAHRDAHGRRAAGIGAGDADLDGVRGLGRQGAERGQCGRAEQGADERARRQSHDGFLRVPDPGVILMSRCLEAPSRAVRPGHRGPPARAPEYCRTSARTQRVARVPAYKSKGLWDFSTAVRSPCPTRASRSLDPAPGTVEQAGAGAHAIATRHSRRHALQIRTRVTPAPDRDPGRRALGKDRSGQGSLWARIALGKDRSGQGSLWAGIARSTPETPRPGQALLTDRRFPLNRSAPERRTSPERSPASSRARNASGSRPIRWGIV